jgi:AraC family transcriptional regulator of adaptative response/methylated-DNA-[protein]-cysteine methyltransferase
MRFIRDSDIGRLSPACRLSDPTGSAEGGALLLTCELPTWFGTATVGLTDRGIQFLSLSQTSPSNSRAVVTQPDLPSFPQKVADLLQLIKDRLSSGADICDLPVDVRGSPFQILVWQYICSIPRGRTASYANVAEAIGHPRAIRAVARACACNTVALAIPCHRVVRSDGSLGGYRWGISLKKLLLNVESSAAEYDHDQEHE